MSLLEHTITTTAPPSAVWAVLEDMAAWGEWNQMTVDRCAGFVEGGSVRFRLRVARDMPVTARFVQVQPERHLVWAGGVPLLFKARHGFDLEPTEDGGTRIRHHEDFGGLLHYPLLWAIRERQQETYRLVNEGLRDAAEARVAAQGDAD